MDPIPNVHALTEGQHPSAGMARAAQMLARPDALMGAQPSPPGSFSNVLVDAIQSVQRAQSESSALQKAYQQGDPEVGLETTMIAMNKASLSFQMLAQARNRVIAAYSEVMNMQV
ncbi:MAG: flagellar hook-basal body complex protein FliE [Pigmentiphaga sp.]|uniref:flagellar hook-basal body complex protein FliE n=1 Tax=Pigmentiphaga sp. TaxID=1977564 RepID=UPI0029AA6962|nr:flagellar hook-basal body complex protein FliE [Pigmentiphaga sp.]MDX3904138.1 flagellar hook-basal body complex protein FliE [Pigmentiphaga sp.]